MGQLDSKLGQRQQHKPALTIRMPKSLVFIAQVITVASLFVLFGTQILRYFNINSAVTHPVSEVRQSESMVVTPTISNAPVPTTSPNLQSPVQPPSPIASKPLNPTFSTPSELSYNVKQSANLPHSEHLQIIVNDVVNLADQRGLPTAALSVSLIDLKTNTYAAYQDQVLRFPASIAKLFWLVELYAEIEQGLIPADHGNYEIGTCKTDVCQMIQDSDNEAASRIVDLLTNAPSGVDLESEAYENWRTRREKLNRFFQQAAFEGINISQKNFPIPNLGLDRPQGADLKMRGDLNHPIRNRLSTAQAGKLMYDIVAGQSVSPAASQKMLTLLTRYDLQTGAWRKKEYDSIRGFFGEQLPPDIYFASKVGWTSESRQEVAYIDSKTGATYILVIFAEHSAYGSDWKIFPDISRLVFDRMTNVQP